MTSHTWDAIVIGAGPAGLMTARALAADGHAVLVLEEHKVIGHPVHCTGLIGMEAFDELSLPRAPVRAIIRRACFHGPDDERIPIEADHIEAAVIDRGEFDQALAGEAERHGAVIRLDARVETLRVDDAGVSVTLQGSAGILRARSCVLACGANYRLSRGLGLGVPGKLVQSAQVEVPFPPADHVDVYVGRDLAPDGFGWVVPFARDDVSRARIGLLCADQPRARFLALLARVWREQGIAGPLPEPHLKALPMAPLARTYADRILVVGDAAGLVKPTTGGGIYYSLLSGQLAADVLGDGLRRDRLDGATLKRYEQGWSARLGPDIRAGTVFRRFAGRMDDQAIRSLLELARTDGLVPLLKRHGNFNWHRRAVIALLRQPAFRRAVLSSFWS